MHTIEQLTDFTVIANSGSNLDLEIEAGVFSAIMTKKKTLPYNRNKGVYDFRENKKISFESEIKLIVSIIESIQHYNDNVIDDGNERRVSIVADDIDVIRNNNSLSVKVVYTPLANIHRSNEMVV